MGLGGQLPSGAGTWNSAIAPLVQACPKRPETPRSPSTSRPNAYGPGLPFIAAMMLPHDAWRGRHDFPAGPSAPSAMATVLMFAEHPLVGLPLALLLRCAARTVPATIDA